MPLYKAGDKVRVRGDLCNGFKVNGTNFVEPMEKYRTRIVTIDSIYNAINNKYLIKEDNCHWIWAEQFFEDVNMTFAENNVLLLKNGQVRLVHDNGIYLPNGTFIETENYTGRKHNFDENFDIVEVRRRATGNYLFDLSGEIIQEEK